MLWGCSTTLGSVSRRVRYAQVASRAVAHSSVLAMREVAGAAAVTQHRTATATTGHAAASLGLSPLGRQSRHVGLDLGAEAGSLAAAHRGPHFERAAIPTATRVIRPDHAPSGGPVTALASQAVHPIWFISTFGRAVAPCSSRNGGAAARSLLGAIAKIHAVPSNRGRPDSRPSGTHRNARETLSAATRFRCETRPNRGLVEGKNAG